MDKGRWRRAALVLSLGLALAVPGNTAHASGPRDRGTAVPSDACGMQWRKPTGGRWSCTFVDNFTGTALDTSRWVVGTSAATGFRIGTTCMTSDNVAVGGGSLLLTARDTGQDTSCTTPYDAFTTRWTGAHVGTIGHFSQAYGKFEVRARYPDAGPGLKGGFWLYPADGTRYGTWPRSGEIDVAEWWSNARTSVLPSLHYAGSRATKDTGWRCQVADPSVFHRYTLLWMRQVMWVLIDGRRCFTGRWAPLAPLLAPQPFDQPFTIVLNMAVDNVSQNRTTAQTRLPATYVVDYVKAWQ
jgi:beta-glucanase (GH16 family)